MTTPRPSPSFPLITKYTHCYDDAFTVHNMYHTMMPSGLVALENMKYCCLAWDIPQVRTDAMINQEYDAVPAAAGLRSDRASKNEPR
jgi:hypothetical protein